MKLRFWGVRGSIAVSGPATVQTGGNTACVELEHEGHRLVLDAGTGIRALGASLGCCPIPVSILFSHVHWDHIQGLPFFLPAFHPGASLDLYGATRSSGGLREALVRQMRPPQFPVPFDRLPAAVRVHELRAAEPFEIGPFRVTPSELNHPDGVLAYRVEAGGRTVTYATDHEHGEQIDALLVALAEGSDLLVHDAQFTDEEYRGLTGPGRRGWGHSTWQQAVGVAKAAEAGRLALFHHDPGRDDLGVARIETWASLARPTAFAAREGETVSL